MARLSSAERRRQLVRAALDVLSAEGLAAATTRRIAERAGVQLATVHYVFADKQELLRAVLEQVTEDIAATLERSIEPGGGLAKAIEDSVHGFWRVVEADPGLQLMQYELTTHALRQPGLAGLAEWQYTRYCEVVEAALREAGRDADRPPVPLPQLARLLVAGVDGVILQFVVHRDVGRARQDVRNLLAALRATALTPG
ncbi:TetR family transcriptional regulator [Prauserella shujinwangii]|uniref:TetR family transcriptional regulator n=1 Tax=Prauserella shujinwangii TaxID=1453103 RepID=A0A2T0M086_9PSEU|nr:TetR/AcrR family transcriptional regulator [Prauserella shujinwangii]PRX49960.1 TetR family transcriptional regulator [Prauserella shujinwangii]